LKFKIFSIVQENIDMAQFYNQNQSNRFSEQVTDITSGSIEKAQQHIYNFFLEVMAHLGLRGKWYSVDTIIGDMVGL
jgi:hypothetical protein